MTLNPETVEQAPKPWIFFDNKFFGFDPYPASNINENQKSLSANQSLVKTVQSTWTRFHKSALLIRGALFLIGKCENAKMCKWNTHKKLQAGAYATSLY